MYPFLCHMVCIFTHHVTVVLSFLFCNEFLFHHASFPMTLFSSMLFTVFMGVVVLTRWLWMLPRGHLHVSLHPLHPQTQMLPRTLNSLFLPVHLPLLFPDTSQTLLLPLCPFPSAIAPTLSRLPGGLLLRPVQALEASVSWGPIPALQGLWFLPIPRFQCHSHSAPKPFL